MNQVPKDFSDSPIDPVYFPQSVIVKPSTINKKWLIRGIPINNDPYQPTDILSINGAPFPSVNSVELPRLVSQLLRHLCSTELPQQRQGRTLERARAGAPGGAQQTMKHPKHPKHTKKMVIWYDFKMISGNLYRFFGHKELKYVLLKWILLGFLRPPLDS